MISEKTVFILGAGASVESGFPTGDILVERIWNNLVERDSYTKNPLNKALQFNKKPLESEGKVSQNFTHIHAQNMLKQFALDLSDSRTSSIDDFLHNTRETADYELIGKLAIIQEISKRESTNVLFRQIEKQDFTFGDQHYLGYQSNWYKTLWKTIYEGCKTLGDIEKNLSKLTFITFNYDRSVEHQLFVSIKAMFQASDETVGNLLDQALKIYHVYGQVGFLPWQKTKIKTFVSHHKNISESKIINPYVPLNLEEDPEQWIGLTSVLKTYGEVDFDDTVQRANQSHFNHHNFNLEWPLQAISDADNVLVFGFSFHPRNLMLFQTRFLGFQRSRVQGKIRGTSLGIGPSIKKQRLSQLGDGLNCDISEKDFLDVKIDDFYDHGLTYK